jgi:hypothetical protein
LTDQAVPSNVPAGGAPPAREPVLRNVVIHLNNEQPVLADLFDLPSPRDVAILCTNMRTPDGKRPVFIDQVNSIFLLPLAHIRFIEVPETAATDTADPGQGQAARGRHRQAQPVTPPEPDLEIDEDFLRRIRDA